MFDTTQKIEMPFGDQSIINNMKNKINYGFIPNDYVIFGTTIYFLLSIIITRMFFNKAIQLKIKHRFKNITINQLPIQQNLKLILLTKRKA
jgi:hypothetical protein